MCSFYEKKSPPHMFPLYPILFSLVHCLPFCALMTYGVDCLSPQLLLNWPEKALRLRELCFLVWLGWWWLAGCKGNPNIGVGANVCKNVQYILQILLNLINEVYVNRCPRGSRKPVLYSKWPLRWSRNNVFFFICLICCIFIVEMSSLLNLNN